MPIMGRLVLFIYNLFILAIAGAVIAISLGWTYPLDYLNMALAVPESRMIVGAIGIIAAVFALISLMWGTKDTPVIDAISVEKGMEGEVSMSIAAAKAIIMKAVRHVEGVRELRPTVIPSANGVTVKLHAMINTDHNVPETAQLLQTVVRESLEKTGGLNVGEIKVLVDDFNAGISK